MKKLSIVVMHKMPNRVRVKFSLPIKDTKNFYNMIKNNLSELRFRYHVSNRNLIVNFETNEILLQEMIYRICIAFSIENGMMPVKLIEEHEYRSVSPISIYALMSIMAASLNKLLNGKDMKLQNSLNIFAMGMTAGSVLEHAYTEVKRKGMFDIEIVPALYLLKSFVDEQKLTTALIMWLTTFGRHLTVPRNSAKLVKVFRIKKNDGYQYTATIMEDNSIENLSDFVYQLFFKKNNPYCMDNEKYITLTKH